LKSDVGSKPTSGWDDRVSASGLPKAFVSEEQLDDVMSRPSDGLIRDLRETKGDIVVVGVGGKMGPTLARMAKRAAPERRVFGVARFTDPSLPERLAAWGVEPVKADLLDRQAVAALPDAPNVIFMAGRKFGSSGGEDLTWAMNTIVPALVAERYAGSRIVAFSTICVYPFVPVGHGGAGEDNVLGPPGEYAMSCVGRERVFQHFSRISDTPGAIVRLSYAIDMRYGVLHDLGGKVMRDEPVDLSMGHVNIIWQGDACSQALRLLNHCAVPSRPFNISGPEAASVRALSLAFGRRFGKTPQFVNHEAETAWLADTSLAAGLFGYPAVSIDRMIDWTADWLQRGMPSLGKATQFEVRSGSY
jgi:hypothetical protein